MLHDTRKDEDENKNGHTYLQWLVALLANTTLVTYGFQIGWVSPMTKILQSPSSPTGIPLTDTEISWVASVICLAAMVGVPMYSYIADTYGRKIAVIALTVPQELCWLIKLSSANTTTIIIARIFCGLATGGCFIVTPMYVKEISQDNIRGTLGNLLILCQNIGVLGIYAMGAYLDYFTVLKIVLVVPILTAVLMIKAPESPAFLLKVGKEEEAAKTIALLRGLDVDHKVVLNEISSLKSEEAYFKSLPDVSFTSILKDKAWRRGLIIMILIMTFNECNGCFAVIMYASTILSSSGVTISPELQTLSFPSVMIIAAFAVLNCIEKFGRKPVLATALILITMAMTCLASIIMVQQLGYTVPGWLSVLCLVVAVSAYAAGMSPVSYVIMSEMFNFQIRAKVMGVLVTYTWFSAFVPLIIFAPISNAMGLYATFYCFGVINLLGLIVTLVMVPETKGKSVEQIEVELRRK